MPRAYIGTSGWNYEHWRNGVFYPKDLKPPAWLAFFAQHFNTVEINNSFYRLPSETVFKNWRLQTPEEFTFAVKASRFITHIKRLKDPADPLDLLFSRVKHLKNRLGPILFQLPPRFRADLERFAVFLEALKQRRGRRVRCVVEVRDRTWLNESVFDLMRRNRVALCFADWRDLHVCDPVTADFVYLRRHFGRAKGNYGKRDLDADANRIQKWLRQGLDVYVYFNNDMKGYAIRNSQYLQKSITS
jgi:uncharacterized protein YecE (DUF72 family)